MLPGVAIRTNYGVAEGEGREGGNGYRKADHGGFGHLVGFMKTSGSANELRWHKTPSCQSLLGYNLIYQFINVFLGLTFHSGGSNNITQTCSSGTRVGLVSDQHGVNGKRPRHRVSY